MNDWKGNSLLVYRDIQLKISVSTNLLFFGKLSMKVWFKMATTFVTFDNKPITIYIISLNIVT